MNEHERCYLSVIVFKYRCVHTSVVAIATVAAAQKSGAVVRPDITLVSPPVDAMQRQELHFYHEQQQEPPESAGTSQMNCCLALTAVPRSVGSLQPPPNRWATSVKASNALN